MSKLLSANMMRLKKSKCFWGGFIFMLVIGMFFPIMNYIDMKHAGYINNLDKDFFTCAIFVSVILSIFCSLFEGTEYSDGTIRNKIIIGHKRIDIYLANLLTSMFAGLILCMIFFVVYLCIGIPLLGFFKTDIKIILLFTVTVIMLAFAFSSFFTMIAMLNGNKTITAVVSILSVFLLMLVGTYVNARLGEPKMVPAYTSINGSPMYEEDTPNPNYLTGTERKVYQFFYDFLPGGQVVQCVSMEAENLHLLAIYSAILFVITTSTGIFIFKQKDIK